jgi:hypothetical protein
MHGFFALALGAAATLALGMACSGGPQKPPPEGGPAPVSNAPPPVPVPADCNDPDERLKAARAGADAEEVPAAVFALAECEAARLGGVKLSTATLEAFSTRLAGVVALYDEVATHPAPKWQIGAAIRLGDLYYTSSEQASKAALKHEVGEWREKARGAYDAGLTVADSTPADTRLDVEISDWVKSACRGLRGTGGNAKKYKVCSPWKESWRG